MRLPPGACTVNLQRGGNVCVVAAPDGTFRIDSRSHDGNHAVVTLNRSEFAALHGALGELFKFYSATATIND
jgi:hypothetical protein